MDCFVCLWWADVSNIAPSFMTEIFIEKNHAHLLRNKSLLQMPKARTVQFGTEGIAFLGCKLWHGLSNDIKQSPNVSVLKSTSESGLAKDATADYARHF